ncbi:MAG: LytR/AlgR family response regulator transcription factor [Anaerovoracaceae bacterium]
MNIAVIEDDAAERAVLTGLMGQYGQQNGLKIQYSEFDSAEAFFADFSPGVFQAVLMDIYLEGQDGMEAARRISRQDPSCRIIFSTVSSEHAVESYDVRAVDYLVKPLTYERFSRAMERVCEEEQQKNRSLFITTGGVGARVRLQDILYTDMMDRRLCLHLRDRVVKLSDRPSEVIENLLRDERFLLCNRSIVVNMDEIQNAEEQDFRMKNGELVPLRKRECAALKRQFLSYSLRRLRKDQEQQ